MAKPKKYNLKWKIQTCTVRFRCFTDLYKSDPVFFKDLVELHKSSWSRKGCFNFFRWGGVVKLYAFLGLKSVLCGNLRNKDVCGGCKGRFSCWGSRGTVSPRVGLSIFSLLNRFTVCKRHLKVGRCNAILDHNSGFRTLLASLEPFSLLQNTFGGVQGRSPWNLIVFCTLKLI